MEETNGIVRIYLVSGDIEEVDEKSFMSAIISSGAGYMKMETNQTPLSEVGFDKIDSEEGEVVFDNLNDKDIEDVSYLSDGSLVPESDLAIGKDNAVGEGTDVTESDEVSPYPEREITAEEILKIIQLVKSGKLVV